MCVLIQPLVVELELQHVSRLLGLQLNVFEMLDLCVVQDLLVQLDALPGPARTKKTQHKMICCFFTPASSNSAPV